MKQLPINKMLDTIISQSDITKWILSDKVTAFCKQARNERIIQQAWALKFPTVIRIG